MPSSVIRHFRYDDASCVLTVHFVSGRTYAYLKVPAVIAAAFQSAESKGTYFNAHIRDHLAYREIDQIRR